MTHRWALRAGCVPLLLPRPRAPGDRGRPRRGVGRRGAPRVVRPRGPAGGVGRARRAPHARRHDDSGPTPREAGAVPPGRAGVRGRADPAERRGGHADGLRHALPGHRRRRDAPVAPRRGGGAGRGKGGRPFGRQGGPELVVLPLDAGGYRQAYRIRALYEGTFDVRQSFLDAQTGELLLEYRRPADAGGGDRHRRARRPEEDQRRAVRRRLHDERPAAAARRSRRTTSASTSTASSSSSTPTARPLNFTSADLGTDADNVWTDGALVDAHVYAGYVYDYYYKRHGRRGLDNANIAVHSITHAVPAGGLAPLLDGHGPDLLRERLLPRARASCTTATACPPT